MVLHLKGGGEADLIGVNDLLPAFAVMGQEVIGDDFGFAGIDGFFDYRQGIWGYLD